MVNKLSNDINEYIKKSTLVTGSARSGTTIVGTLISSFENTEYFFEPPTLFTLFANYNKSSKEVMEQLLTTYLFEDLLIQRLMGRNFNCNINDDSSVYKIYSKNEIEQRIHSDYRKKNLIKFAFNKSLIFKMPDIVPIINDIDFLKKLRIIRCKRNVAEQINSLMEKKWFSNIEEERSEIWPNTYIENKIFPFWLNKNFYELWYKCSDIDRCYIYTAHMEKEVNSKNQLIIKYEELIKNKFEIIENISNFLNQNTTDRTMEIAKNIKIQNTTKSADMKKISDEVKYIAYKHLSFFDEE